MVETIEWTSDGVVMIDQTRLPREERIVTCRSYQEVADAIRNHGDPRSAGHRRRGRDGRRAGVSQRRGRLTRILKPSAGRWPLRVRRR